ncbi:hypothetical protein [Amycolatopsis sp. MEPSY49]|uniref:hypothetical protein n=1 Tax=Amycolatopsis sp. MEPSY49 TaxID=3151600 RepID=UPI003EF514AA
MDEAQAISTVVSWIRSTGMDYPTEGLEAERFEVGWCVYEPVEVDDSDPFAFLEMPVGRTLFLVGDSGRVKLVSSSTPPRVAQDEFVFEELAARPAAPGSEAAAFMTQFELAFRDAAAGGPPVFREFHHVPPDDDGEATAAEAARLIDPIVRELARLGPPGWEQFTAEFSVTVSAEVAQLRFWAGGGSGLVPVPRTIAELVRRQRQVAARMPAGPWWRLLLAVADTGETSVEYDYGDEPFPDDQLLAPGHYRNDLDAHPRPRVPVWLAGYAAGPGAQGRSPRRAALASGDPGFAVAASGIPALDDLWTRWAVLSAVHAGTGSERGPRIHPGYAWYEDDHRSGSTLYVLPGGRAVLSGGRWNSPLLDAAYNGGRPLPDLYTGAPAWVTDAVLNTRTRNGLLSFCFWWTGQRWFRGPTDTTGELAAPLPPVRTAEETVRAMAAEAGTAAACGHLLEAAARHEATIEDVIAVLEERPGADVFAAADQLSLAGLLEP